MPKYNVLLCPVVNMRVNGVEARNQVAAIKKAERMVDINSIFNNHHPDAPVAYIEATDKFDAFLVDVEGDKEFSKSTWYDNEYAPL